MYHYFPRRDRTAPKCMLRRYNPETMTRGQALVMCCMRCPCLHHVRIGPCTFLVSLPPSCGNPVTGITPPSFACSVHPQFLLHRHLDELSDHRNVVVVPFSLSLSWHPVSIRHGDQMLHNMLMPTFSQTCIKLVYVIRIMITTFKMFKIVFALNC